MKIRQRHFIKSSEIKALKSDISKYYDDDLINQLFPDKCKVEMILTEEGDILYAVDDELTLWKSKHGYVPVLSLFLKKEIKLKTIIVDMGAVRFVTNKADIMRPGITKIDTRIKKGDIVKIVDETHNRVLAIGKTLFDAKEMELKSSGKVIINLHTIKDAIWKFEKSFK